MICPVFLLSLLGHVAVVFFSFLFSFFFSSYFMILWMNRVYLLLYGDVMFSFYS